MSGEGRNGVYLGPFAFEDGCDEAFVLDIEFAGAVLGADLGKPRTDPDGVAVDSDRLAGCGGTAFAMEEQFEDLDGLGESAPGLSGGVSGRHSRE